MNNIKVSVVLPVYNGASYLSSAIKSILNQTHGNFELIVLNDGSKDDSEGIIQSLQAKDKRIKYIKNEINLGLIATLNKGFDAASGKYIARMDQDDISCPERLRLQVEFLERLKTPAIVGCNEVVIDEDNKVRRIPRKIHAKASENFWIKFRKCPVNHPTVMMSREVLASYRPVYQSQDIHAEDHCAWLRLNKTIPIYNIKVPLLFYRIHKTNYTTTNTSVQISKILAVLDHYYIETLSYKISKTTLQSLLFLELQPTAELQSTFHDILGAGKAFIGKFGREEFVKRDLAYCIFSIGLKSNISTLIFAISFIFKNMGHLPLLSAIVATSIEGLKQVFYKSVYSLKLHSILRSIAE